MDAENPKNFCKCEQATEDGSLPRKQIDSALHDSNNLCGTCEQAIKDGSLPRKQIDSASHDSNNLCGTCEQAIKDGSLPNPEPPKSNPLGSVAKEVADADVQPKPGSGEYDGPGDGSLLSNSLVASGSGSSERPSALVLPKPGCERQPLRHIAEDAKSDVFRDMILFPSGAQLSQGESGNSRTHGEAPTVDIRRQMD